MTPWSLSLMAIGILSAKCLLQGNLLMGLMYALAFLIASIGYLIVLPLLWWLKKS